MLIKKHKNFLLKGAVVSFMLFSSPAFATIPLPPQDYVETIRVIDFYSNRVNDKFLNTLANEYKSYALFKANYTPDYNMANYFATKALNAYHGEYVRPENIYKRNLPQSQIVEISNYYDDLLHLLETDLVHQYPQLMAEAQAKFDCWIDSTSNRLSRKQALTCQNRFMKARNHLLAKLNNDCNCKKTKKTTTTKKTLSKYDGKILPIPKWPNLPAITNNPPVPVVKQTVVKELTISKEIKNSLVKIENSIIEINKALANGQTKADIDNIKKEIAELKRLLENSNQGDFAELKNRLADLENSLSNIFCTNDNISNEPEIQEPEPEIEPSEPEEEPIEEEPADTEPEEILVEEFEQTPDEEEPFEVIDEEEYLEIEVSDASSDLLPYEIFFDWNNANVKPEFDDALADIANQAIDSGEIIVIKGHTDASGTPEYNQKLSKKRAENVGKIIMSYGVPRDKIILQGVGSTEPKVKTKAGEKNAENRRVVIK
ncbi:MAG: OmpA family protein [Alphaproteobacteria bacterium]|nr:OmpA family protein [Alphaproteobacteria bacterium]